VADAVFARVGIGPSTPRSEPAAATVLPFPGRPVERRRALLLWSGAGAALALAAGLTITLVDGPRSGLPDYAFSIEGQGATEVRGDEPTPSPTPRYAAGNALTVLARPAERTGTPVHAAAFVGGPDESLAPWPARLDVDESGAVRVRDTVGSGALVGVGPRTLYLAVTPTPLALPAASTASALAEAVRAVGGHLSNLRIQLVEGDVVP
jgi:hypothetical protein